MPRISLVEAAHAAIRPLLGIGGLAVDATLGNGHDTLFLASQVGEQGRVYGFDIQQQALDSTRQRLLAAGLLSRVSLFRCDHARIAEHVPLSGHGGIAAAMFNLGYLPGGDKSMVTTTGSTLPALAATAGLLAPAGVMTVLAYPGHPGGAAEAGAVADWCAEAAASGRFALQIRETGLQRTAAPILYILHRQSLSWSG